MHFDVIEDDIGIIRAQTDPAPHPRAVPGGRHPASVDINRDLVPYAMDLGMDRNIVGQHETEEIVMAGTCTGIVDLVNAQVVVAPPPNNDVIGVVPPEPVEIQDDLLSCASDSHAVHLKDKVSLDLGFEQVARAVRGCVQLTVTLCSGKRMAVGHHPGAVLGRPDPRETVFKSDIDQIADRPAIFGQTLCIRHKIRHRQINRPQTVLGIGLAKIKLIGHDRRHCTGHENIRSAHGAVTFDIENVEARTIVPFNGIDMGCGGDRSGQPGGHVAVAEIPTIGNQIAVGAGRSG